MAEKPTTLPRWATDGGTTLEPSSGDKDTGFVVNTRPPARWVNWLLNTTYQWMQYLDAPVGTGSGAAITGTGGDSDGPGLKGIGGATNGVGVEGSGTGTGAGGYFYGATATGARGLIGYGSSGGTTGGDGGYFRGGTGSSTDGAGVVAEGQGTGVGISATGVTGAAGTFDSANTTGTVQATNSSTGAGLRGVGYVGVAGISNSGAYGVYGAHTGGGSGVFGSSASGYGVEASSANNFAVFAQSTSSTGVRGASSTSQGVWGTSVDGTAVYGYSNNGYGGHFQSDTSHGLVVVGDQFSPVKSSLYIAQQDADPSNSDVGSVYLHGSAGQMSIKTNHNVWARVQNKIYAAVSDTDTVAQSGDFAQTFTLPGSTLRPGSTIRIRATAHMTSGSINAANFATLTLSMASSLGGSRDLAYATRSNQASSSSGDCILDIDVVVTARSIGAGGIIVATGIGNSSLQNIQYSFAQHGMQCISNYNQGSINMTGTLTIKANISCQTAGTVFKLDQLIISTND